MKRDSWVCPRWIAMANVLMTTVRICGEDTRGQSRSCIVTGRAWHHHQAVYAAFLTMLLYDGGGAPPRLLARAAFLKDGSTAKRGTVVRTDNLASASAGIVSLTKAVSS